MTLAQLITEVRKIIDHSERLEWLALREAQIKALPPEDDVKFRRVWEAIRDAEGYIDRAIAEVR